MKYKRFAKIVWIWNYCHNHSILNKQTSIVKIANGTMFQNINRNNGVKYHSVIILCARLCIAQRNPSIGVNVVSKGSPSRMRMVRRISLGITTRPRLSMRRTIPVAFIYESLLVLSCLVIVCKERRIILDAQKQKERLTSREPFFLFVFFAIPDSHMLFPPDST